MPALEFITLIVMGASCFLFVGFCAFFIIPDAFITIVYLIPKTLKHVNNKQVQRSIFWALLRKPFMLVCCAVGLAVIVYLLSPSTALFLLSGPVAIFCWVLVIPVLSWAYVNRRNYLDAYYTNIYMEYTTENERQRHRDFIERVEMFSVDDAKQELANAKLSYLERKALKARIDLLESGKRSAKH